ncbi:MAG: Na+/H+ antiporter NhaC family protein [Chlamydiota bacterium]
MIGILLSALIATGGHFYESGALIFQRLMETIEVDLLFSKHTFFQANTPFILAFLLGSGLIIEMMRYSGGAKALVTLVRPHINSKKTAESSSLILSHCLLIDDYLSCLTVGSVLRPLTDSFRIPRVKLAFLVNIIAAPLTIICPLSSWAAVIMGFLNENGIGFPLEKNMIIIASTSEVYLRTLAYILYSFTVIITTWIIVRRRYSFGIINKHELIAAETGNLVGNKKDIKHEELEEEEKRPSSNHIADFLIPFCGLLFSAFLWLLYFGDSTWFGGSRSFIDALQNTKVELVLFMASLVSIGISLPYYLIVRRFTLKDLPQIAQRGIEMMMPAILILILAITLGALIRHDVKTGEYLAKVIGQSMPPFLLPAIFFGIATLTALSLGSSFGSTALLLPIAIPLVPHILNIATPTTPEALPLIFPVFGAILSGSICGGNFSLLNDIAIMSSTSCDCDHIDHIKSQVQYVIPMFIGSFIGFLVMGLLVKKSMMASILVPIVLSITISLTIIKVLDKRSQRVMD